MPMGRVCHGCRQERDPTAKACPQCGPIDNTCLECGSKYIRWENYDEWARENPLKY
jgi:predicted amidophosphoribosyltransferase